jgi:large subunit ribosomal protein L15
VLGNGEVAHALTVRVHKVSAGARAKIEATGGTVEIIPTKVYEKTKRSKNQDTKAPIGQAQSTRK